MNTRAKGVQLTFAPSIPVDVHKQARQLIDDWAVPEMQGQAFAVSALSGGGSNINLKLEGGPRALTMRICFPEAERWGVLRAASIQTQRDAAALDLAPPVLACTLPEGHFLSVFLSGGTLSTERLRQDCLMPRCIELLHRLHRGTTTARDFSPFDDARTFREFGLREGAKVPQGFELLHERLRRIEQVFLQSKPPRAFCHSDLVMGNLIIGGDRVRLIDWDYAGNGWVAFELAMFACQAQLSIDETDTFLRLYDPAIDDGQRARVALMRAVAGIREATWAFMAEPILAGRTTPTGGAAFYQNHAAHNMAQAESVWREVPFEHLLEQAARVRAGALF